MPGGSGHLPGRAACDFAYYRDTIKYAYGKRTFVSSSFSISYAYGSKCFTNVDSRFIGFKAYSTQATLNNLPPWMRLRTTEAAVGWRLANAWNISVDKQIELMNKQLRNLFLTTADRHQRSSLFKGTIAVNELFEDRPTINLLHNSTLSIRSTARSRLPVDWYDAYFPSTQVMFLDTSRPMVGTYCLRADSPGTIGQITSLNGIGEVDKISASVYVRSDSNFRATLSVVVEDINGVSIGGEQEFYGHTTEWERIKLTFTVGSEVFKAQYTLRVTAGTKVYIDAPQLELGPQVTSWQGSDTDRLVYLDTTLGFKMAEVVSNNNRVSLFPIGSTNDFSDMLIPTRVEIMPVPSRDLEPFSNDVFGARVDVFDQRTPISWAIDTKQIVERDANNKFEIFARYDLRDLQFFEGQGYGTIADCDVDVTIIASAVRDDLLFVAVKEVYRGRTIRVLKVVRPRRPPNDETYLESFTDFELDLGFDTTYGQSNEAEEIDTIGFSERDPSWLVVNTTLGRRFYFRLYYDYYYVRYDTRDVYTLEEYSGATIRIT